MNRLSLRFLLLTSPIGLFVLALVVACSGSGSSTPPTAQVTGTPGAEQALGERLFMETRFAQAFQAFLDAGGDVNDPNAGDPVVDSVETLGVPITAEDRSKECR